MNRDAYIAERIFILDCIKRGKIDEIPDSVERKKAYHANQGLRAFDRAGDERLSSAIQALDEFWATWRYTRDRVRPGDPPPDEHFLRAMGHERRREQRRERSHGYGWEP